MGGCRVHGDRLQGSEKHHGMRDGRCRATAAAAHMMDPKEGCVQRTVSVPTALREVSIMHAAVSSFSGLSGDILLHHRCAYTQARSYNSRKCLPPSTQQIFGSKSSVQLLACIHRLHSPGCYQNYSVWRVFGFFTKVYESYILTRNGREKAARGEW